MEKNHAQSYFVLRKKWKEPNVKATKVANSNFNFRMGEPRILGSKYIYIILTSLLFFNSLDPCIGSFIQKQSTLQSHSFGRVPINLGGNQSFREARRSVVSGGIFTLISFENVPCNATTGDIGLCYSTRECTNLGGTTAGNCAGNYGVCCVVTQTCGSNVTLNNTYFVNPAYPSTNTGPLACSITVTKLTGASQLYLEFTAFSLLGPTLGACTNDSFSVTVLGGTTTTYPILCGVIDPGAMEYINLSIAPGPVTLSFSLTATTDLRSWKIRLVQFKPGDFCAAPTGCNQYYRGVSGTLDSYNFNGGQGQLLNNYCIQICFQNQVGYCNLLLTETNFMLTGISPSDCTSDYFLINGIKFCGDTFNNGMVQVNQTAPGSPISIIFCSGPTHPDMDLGYNLQYNFLPCATG